MQNDDKAFLYFVYNFSLTKFGLNGNGMRKNHNPSEGAKGCVVVPQNKVWELSRRHAYDNQ
jgi:hypothetical protein